MNLAWTWDEIDQDWLLGSKLAATPDEVVTAFNRVDHVLGRGWIEASRTHSGVPSRGTLVTLHVVTTGQLLANLDSISGTDELIEKLRIHDASAFAELTALHLIRSQEPSSIIEVGPSDRVGDRNRRPDFRVRLGSEAWIYVEVTQPDIAEAQTRVQNVLNRIADLLQPIKKGFALEVFLRREPTNEDLEELVPAIQDVCVLEGHQSRDLPGLAILTLNASQPGLVVPLEHSGEPNVPRLGCAKALSGLSEPHRHISVRMAYADDRAEDFLRKEAKQLPSDSPGLIMVQMSRAPGGFKSWEPVLRRRLQPTQHTRVSMVCLFGSGYQLTPEGEAWILETKLIPNPNARFPLSTWITDALSKAGSG
jgi:hypothetical protein